MPRSVDPGPNVLTNTSVAWMLRLSSLNGDYWGFCGILGIAVPLCLNWDFWDWEDFWDFVVVLLGDWFWVGVFEN